MEYTITESEISFPIDCDYSLGKIGTTFPEDVLNKYSIKDPNTFGFIDTSSPSKVWEAFLDLERELKIMDAEAEDTLDYEENGWGADYYKEAVPNINTDAAFFCDLIQDK